ncbi:hypothetical protein ACQSSU_20465 [Micromonospora echinospora]
MGNPSENELAPLHPDATGFTLLRVLGSGDGRTYTGVEFTDGWQGANRFLRRLRAVGYICNSSDAPDGYHVLDVLNAEGDIIQDYAVPPHPSRAFAYIKKKLRLQVATIDPRCSGSAKEQGAKREAHRIAALLINQYLERPGDDDPENWPQVEAALRELEASHLRRGQGGAR